MSERRLFYPLSDLHLVDATLDESDSFDYLSTYSKTNYLYYKYSYPDVYTLDEITNMINNFSLFFAKIKDSTGTSYPSSIPLHVFRYIMLDDMSYSPYYTIRRKPGYVVEGIAWSNGMYYAVREDLPENFQTYQIVLYLDSYTKTLHGYP